ncbi:fibronectin-binding protein [Dissulfurispira thermophila]|uniref:Fibronectin-binding protein n=2 Tax=root TaxID=1 RepID=A0A7G1H091_9BACT|nr:7-cyano-7-deazaguanine synthase [Dissulfurispira thermophila]BCB95127.1 fibronectin-binding protein [Dissulfurispira thermophila]
MPKAIALYSGGLDSTLAILVAKRQGIEVTAITCLTHFGCDISDKSSCSKNPFAASEKFGFEVKLCHLADKFIEIVKNPKFGHGRNMNPCIDCRILMLKEAKEFMRMTGAEFIITGEVLGQRPMSQRKDTFPRIDRESGLEGYVLRPLSAKLLKPTIPEQMGIVDREKLYDFHGRSRKQQMKLAEEFGLTEYPAPAGGCLLTDPIYAYRLKELLRHNPSPSLKDINLLRVGRHFRISNNCKIVVGRDENENNTIQSLVENTDYLLSVNGFGSPLTIICGDASDEAIKLAAAICARYSDAKKLPVVEVSVLGNGEEFKIQANPRVDNIVDSLRIQPFKEVIA